MSTDTTVPAVPEAVTEAEHEAYLHEQHKSDWEYVKIFLALVIITALEVYASYAGWLGDAFIPVILVLMAIKFVLVVLYFMHLKTDAKVFGFLFWSGLVLAVAVYVVTLATFKFFIE